MQCNNDKSWKRNLHKACVYSVFGRFGTQLEVSIRCDSITNEFIIIMTAQRLTCIICIRQTTTTTTTHTKTTTMTRKEGRQVNKIMTTNKTCKLGPCKQF